ncbi:hypothetical protein BGZ99_008925 [Dissophora globulifera]|uniref:Uncharacterized protein n=1 Tax=Dissophora globulifera TaxID=979702 RepID=A0A9P6RRT1_9FUNG|nr:hypothetical protein BGZ99_008925 [Dissophora globulifera]
MSTSTCILTECAAYLTDANQCTNSTLVVTPENLSCLCTTTVIADYTTCYPCLITVPGVSNTLTVAAYTSACQNKQPINPVGSSFPSYTVPGNPQPTTNTGSNNSSSGNSSSSGSHTGMYIGIGCAVGAVIIAIAAFFVVRSRRNLKQDGKSAEYAAVGPPPPMQQVPQNQFVQPNAAIALLPPQSQQQYQQSPYQQQQLGYSQPQQQQNQLVYSQPQQQQHQAFMQQPPSASGYYATPFFADPNQQQQQQQQTYYPTVATPSVPTQPTPSPTFAANDSYYDQQPQQQQQQQTYHQPAVASITPQASVATVSGLPDQQQPYQYQQQQDHNPALTPMLMPSQSNTHTLYSASTSSPTATVMSASVPATTLYEPSVAATDSPAIATTDTAAIKPAVSSHGPQYYNNQYESQTTGPKNPQYISSEGAYHR